MKTLLTLMLAALPLACERTAPQVETATIAATAAPAEEPDMIDQATFAAGCFWGVESAFRQLDGVVATRVGYAGGQVPNPTYRQVCTDATGHAEAVQVDYDPEVVSYDRLLEVFWASHDPTQVNRQGPDIGSQYRSVIFYHNDGQRQAALNSKARLEEEAVYDRPIATEIVPAGDFWIAEDYHQQYLEKRGLATCHVNLQPAP